MDDNRWDDNLIQLKRYTHRGEKKIKFIFFNFGVFFRVFFLFLNIGIAFYVPRSNRLNLLFVFIIFIKSAHTDREIVLIRFG